MEAAEETLKVLGVAPSQASRAVEVFRKHDEKVLKEQFEVRHDERQMIVSAQNSMKQLESILKAESLGEESNQTQT